MSRANARWRRWARAGLSAVLCGALAGRLSAATSDPGVLSDGDDWVRGTSLYLEVTVNATATGQIAHFDERDGELYARTATLRGLGILPPAQAEDPLRLGALAGARIAYDRPAQRLDIVVPAALLAAPPTRLSAGHGAGNASAGDARRARRL